MKKILLITITLFSIAQLQAQGWGEIQKMVPDDRFAGQYFGAHVAIDGNYAVVGVLVNNFAKDAYVFENDGNGNWIQIQKLQSPQNHQFDHFGTAVAIDGDYIFVGSWGNDYDASESNYLDSAGAVFIFKKQASGNFEFEQKIVASDRVALNAFGYGIALNGNYAVVSPVRHDFDASGNNFLDDAGAAYIFERDGSGTWNEVQKIVASDRDVQDFFGQTALAVSDNYIVVGAFQEDEDENGANTIPSTGSAYIFERDGLGTWNEVQKIVASDRAQGDYFGFSVALDGDDLVVGCVQDDSFTGSAYVFKRDGSGNWSETQKLTASDASAQDRFGQSVSIDANHIIVGAYTKNFTVGDTTYPAGGGAYIFEQDGVGTWTQIQNIYGLDRAQSDYFGYSVAISGDNVIVGAYQEGEDENGENFMSFAGSAYIFNANEPSTLSVGVNNFSTEITAYPNPNSGHFTIDLKKIYNHITISITNILGQNIQTETLQSSDKVVLDITAESGIYFVNISTEAGHSAAIKIIKN